MLLEGTNSSDTKSIFRFNEQQISDVNFPSSFTNFSDWTWTPTFRFFYRPCYRYSNCKSNNTAIDKLFLFLLRWTNWFEQSTNKGRTKKTDLLGFFACGEAREVKLENVNKIGFNALTGCKLFAVAPHIPSVVGGWANSERLIVSYLPNVLECFATFVQLHQFTSSILGKNEIAK